MTSLKALSHSCYPQEQIAGKQLHYQQRQVSGLYRAVSALAPAVELFMISAAISIETCQ